MDTCWRLRNNRAAAVAVRALLVLRPTWKDRPIAPVLYYVGLTLCLLASGRVAMLALGGWSRTRHRQRRYESDKRAFVEEVAVAARAARADRHEYLAWTGTRPLRIAAIVDEAEDVKSFYLSDADGGLLPSFEPGQYLTCHFETAPGEKPLVRCYSLSDRPREEYYRLTVKRCDAPDDQPLAPPGRASNRLHAMQVGDSLAVSAPRGGFFLDPRRNHPLVLIAGGIGVTPMVSILASLAAANDRREVYFFYGVRNSREHPLRDQLEQIGREHLNLHQFVSYSQPLPRDREHHDYHHRGRIDVDYLQRVLPSGQFDYYLCGPGPMMEQLVEGLLAAGVPEDRILYEAFGPASIRRVPAIEKSAAAKMPSGPLPTVRLATSERQVDWDGDCESLLELIEGLGVAIDSGCRAGNCGMCAARVLEGDIEMVKQPGAQAPEGYCLACISVPKSPVVLEL
ncbi:2Fe-2S iron-sulfur cluster-binding protein [Aeoliella sp. SH292]|uniref:2Fe-2S iron-sulfur cluster-binding protein n=1 Tax=Aeoliella sp. SH292 TaxID=3454464 RepID=UPI003F96CCB0